MCSTLKTMIDENLWPTEKIVNERCLSHGKPRTHPIHTVLALRLREGDRRDKNLFVCCSSSRQDALLSPLEHRI